MWRMHRDERLAGEPRAPMATWRRGVLVRVAAVTAATLLTLPGLAPTVAAQESQLPSEARPVADVSLPALTVGEVAGNPGEYYGKLITVSGTVDTILGPDGVPLDVAALAGQDVTVVGRVHQFNLAAFEDQLSVDLEDAHFGPWSGKPAIVANAVRPLGADEPAWTSSRPSAAAPTDPAREDRAGGTGGA